DPHTHFFFSSHCDHHALHSFPTRRSSDLRTDRFGWWETPMWTDVVTPNQVKRAVRLAGDRSGEVQLAEHEIIDVLLRTRRTIERSEEHTSELQSQSNLVCRLLLEKKKHYTPKMANSTLASISSPSQRPPALTSTARGGPPSRPSPITSTVSFVSHSCKSPTSFALK